MDKKMSEQETTRRTKLSGFAALSLAALGVVYGDLGTSPLYALRECFAGNHAIAATPDNIIGVTSLILWFLMVIVSLKYVVFVMHADNKGEGGVLALMALVHRLGPARVRSMAFIAVLGVIGASLLFSDGIITPSISVLSAVEGLLVITPTLEPFIIPISLLILAGLFALQSRGTARIGSLFGPILCVWFLMIAVLGVAAIVNYPAILAALNPLHALTMLSTLGWKSFALLATAFLAITGVEVLYADMGHFGKKPIRFVWFALVFPALILNYLGQGAHLLHAPLSAANLFFQLAPQWFLFPCIIIATLATIIASQAVITGMFSLAKQSVQLGFWPRLKIKYTSLEHAGQVYVPFINIMLFCLTVLFILYFKKSGNLASAYGIAVATTMLITTALIFLIARSLWPKIPTFLLMPLFTVFLLFHIVLFLANMTKFLSGGWVVVVISIVVVAFMTSWLKGRALLGRKIEAESLPFDVFVADIVAKNPARVKGTAVFLAGSAQSTPRALLHNYKHNQALHERIIVLSVLNEEIPFVAAENRSSLAILGSGIYRIYCRFGFMETPDLPSVLRTISIAGRPIDPMQVSYFLGKELLVISNTIVMPTWRKRIFAFLSRNSTNASSFFKLPPNRVVEFGSQIEF
jgi:KUP system potassium uptake protein